MHTPHGGGPRRESVQAFPDHASGLKAMAEELAADGVGLDSPSLPPSATGWCTAAAVHRADRGHRRGADRDPGLVPVAPLHNPANIIGIEVARALRPDLPQIAVFDTAFHTTVPEYAARYAIDRRIADEHRVRRYGFHGTSHQYVSRATARLLGRDPAEVNVIVLHLGNGASASAVAAASAWRPRWA